MASFDPIPIVMAAAIFGAALLCLARIVCWMRAAARLDESERGAAAQVAPSRRRSGSDCIADNDDKETERRLTLLRWMAPVQLVLKADNLPPDRGIRRSRSWRGGFGCRRDALRDESLGRVPAPDGFVRSDAAASLHDESICIPAPGLLVVAPQLIAGEAAPTGGVVDHGGEEGGGGCDDGGPAPDSNVLDGHPEIAGGAGTGAVPAARGSLLRYKPMRWASGTCTICLLSYRRGESVTWSSNPECEHCFHTSCIEEWVLRRHPNNNQRPGRGQQQQRADYDAAPHCPNCRRAFVQDPYEIEA